MYSASPWPVRPDISRAHTAWLDHVAAAGAWWTGDQRIAFVAALWDSLDDPDPPPPWAPPKVASASPLPPIAHAVAARLARHAATATDSWYHNVLDELNGNVAAFVELAALAAQACAVGSFGPALGLARPPLPPPKPGDPSCQAPELVDAAMNWVPVTPPADIVPAVVQAFSAAPTEHAMTWRLAAAQYIPLEEMTELDWRRTGSPLHRRQLELVAARLSLARECFY